MLRERPHRLFQHIVTAQSGITLDANANVKLENARLRAIQYIDAARVALSNLRILVLYMI